MGGNAEVELPRLQRWMQSVVVHPGDVEEALRSEAAERELPADRLADLVLPSRTLTPSERVEIYHGMYLLRMHDALSDDYEALRHFLGDEAFFDLVRDYVEVYPSRHFSLNRLGDHLPDFIRESAQVSRRSFCHDLARLELAITQLFDAPHSPSLQPEAISAVAEAAWPEAVLKPVEAFRLLSFRYPVSAYLQTVQDDNHDHPETRVKLTWVVVFRSNYGMRRLDLSRAAHDLLADLALGVSLRDAISKAAPRRRRAAATQEQLFGWFRDWVSSGMFQSVTSC